MFFTRKSLENLSEAAGFPVDQLSFIAGMTSSFFLAVLYNIFLSPQKASRTTRLAIGLLWGVAIGWLCYASDILQLMVLPVVCYIIICTVSPEIVHRYVFLVALFWLSLNHIYRQVTDYGGYKLDITGPIMLITQRVTYVGYALHDGLGRDSSELTEEQKTHSLKKKPSILEFFSYNFHFSMLLAGPSCTYFEYIQYIEGADLINGTVKNKDFKNHLIPFPLITVVRKTVLAFVFLGGVLISYSLISVQTCVDLDFISRNSLISRVVYAYIAMYSVRIRYYFAWTLADAINNAAGMGFSGYDKDGNALWDKYSNCNIKNIELATSTKTVLANWNITTVRWLKRTVYDRTERCRVLATFLVSAFWHGFYPGYYLCFVSVGLITMSARLTRHSFRTYFQESRTKQIFYDILTWLVTTFFMMYNTMVFVMLHLESAIVYWRSMYFFGHVLTLLGFASPWLSKVLGMKKITLNRKENKIDKATVESRNNFTIKAPKEE